MIYYFDFAEGNYQITISRGFIQQRGDLPFHVRYYGLILAFFSFIYPLLSLLLLFRHRNRIENEFSNIEKINLNWLRYWIIISMTSFWVSFIIIWVAQYEWVNYLTSFQTVATQLTLNIVIVGFYGLRQTTIFTNINSELISTAEEEEVPRQISRDEDEQATITLKKIKGFMLKEKPYLNSQLNIESLSAELHMTRHELSRVINEQLGVNFFNFVNHYRIEEVKRRIADEKYQHLTLLGIAFETGFNSKSSFNHIFKKMEGMTPSEFKKQISNK